MIQGATATPRVLIIDPYPDEGEMFADYLRGAGFDVDVRLDPVDGLRTASYRPPDVVVTRLRQADPVLDGIDIVKRLKRSANSGALPVVIITTSVLPGDELAAEAAQCDAYLKLPLTPPQLEAEVRRLLEIREIKR